MFKPKPVASILMNISSLFAGAALTMTTSPPTPEQIHAFSVDIHKLPHNPLTRIYIRE